MGEIPYGELERDLSRLVADRVSEAVRSVLQLTENTGQAYLVTLTAANTCAGLWAGAFAAHHDTDVPAPADAIAAFAEVMREVVQEDTGRAALKSGAPDA